MKHLEKLRFITDTLPRRKLGLQKIGNFGFFGGFFGHTLSKKLGLEFFSRTSTLQKIGNLDRI